MPVCSNVRNRDSRREGDSRPPESAESEFARGVRDRHAILIARDVGERHLRAGHHRALRIEHVAINAGGGKLLRARRERGTAASAAARNSARRKSLSMGIHHFFSDGHCLAPPAGVAIALSRTEMAFAPASCSSYGRSACVRSLPKHDVAALLARRPAETTSPRRTRTAHQRAGDIVQPQQRRGDRRPSWVASHPVTGRQRRRRSSPDRGSSLVQLASKFRNVRPRRRGAHTIPTPAARPTWCPPDSARSNSFTFSWAASFTPPSGSRGSRPG